MKPIISNIVQTVLIAALSGGKKVTFNFPKEPDWGINKIRATIVVTNTDINKIETERNFSFIILRIFWDIVKNKDTKSFHVSYIINRTTQIVNRTS